MVPCFGEDGGFFTLSAAGEVLFGGGGGFDAGLVSTVGRVCFGGGDGEAFSGGGSGFDASMVSTAGESFFGGGVGFVPEEERPFNLRPRPLPRPPKAPARPPPDCLEMLPSLPSIMGVHVCDH